MKKVQFVFTILLIINFSLTALCQKETNIWYFGDLAGLDFNSGSPVALTNGALSTTEGCSSMSDANGSLLFYTDGITVWNKLHVPMANGTGLLGNTSSTQSGLIIKQPGNANIYYVFTIDVNFCYSIVDISLNGGLGGVTSKNVVIINNCNSEKQCATLHSNGSDVWVMMRQTATNGFKAFLLTAAGLNLTAVTSNIGVINGSPYGQLKFSPDGSRCAFGVSGGSGGNNIMLFDFDNSTGIVSNIINIPTTYSQCYGVEFSPDNTKLYATANPGVNLVYQFDLNAGSAAAIIASATLIGSTTSDATGMQLAPDGKIYVCAYGSSYLDVISNPDSLGLNCNYVQNGVYLGGKTCALGLPESISNIFGSFTFINTCFGDSTFFSIANGAALWGATWDFNDPASGINNTSFNFNPVHLFTAPGTYNVLLIKYSAAGTDSIYRDVIIDSVPVFNLGSDTIFCSNSVYNLSVPGTFSSYTWQDGSTNSSFTVSVAGTYWVTVSNGNCNATDSIVLTTILCNSPIIAFSSSDTSQCEKTCIDFTDLSTNNPTSWQWSFPGADSLTSSQQNPIGICYNNYGSFDVTLIACNANGCDTLIISNFISIFQSPPAPTIIQNLDTLICTTPASSYQWYFNNLPIAGATQSTYVSTQQGLYYVIITDGNQCNAASNSITINGIGELGIGNWELAIVPNPNDGSFTMEVNGELAPDSYRDGNWQLAIVNPLGEIIYEKDFENVNGKFSQQIDLRDTAKGIYFLKVMSDEKIFMQKIIIN